ncbi:MAG: L-seryl-tRNA(Sec) selenium transferase [Polyangiales bacterium]
MSGNHDALRALPAVAALLESPEARALRSTRAHAAVAELARAVIDEVRAELREGALPADRDALLALARVRLTAAAERRERPALRSVINATGVVLHTNLGRAPLGDEVMRAVRDGAMGYAALEYDLEAGARGHRDDSVLPALRALTGAEDALVVNNCAAAVLLACSALAAGREVIVSRGELVEIGGGFRIPEVIASCGASLVEVGTTNRTHPADYARALSPRTGAILRVHQSNFSVRGFTASASLAELSALAAPQGVPVLADLGSGALLDTRDLGLPAEPTARDALAEGADLVMFSGDKLLGGPQAGVVVGRADLVRALRRHPLTRALRPGRLVLAALGAVLKAYENGRATRELPALAALAEAAGSVRARADAAATRVELPEGAALEVVSSEARVGGGTLPDATVPSWALRLSGRSPHRLEAALRLGSPPVIARRAGDALLVDLRTVRDDEVIPLAQALTRALASTPETEHASTHRGEREAPEQEVE